jgi:transposase-like protein
MTERTKDQMIGSNALAMDGALEGARRATGKAPSIAPPADPEVVAMARRRQFSGAEKRRILLAADRCTKPGEVGALLRSEGIYSSLLATWRRQRDRGDTTVLEARKRGRKPDALGIGYEVKEAANNAPYIDWDQHPVLGSEIESLLQYSQPGDGDKLREAMDWLKDKLSTGPMPSAQIVRIAKKDGVAERTLERAKQKLGVKASSRAGHWEWHLPPPQSPALPPQAVPSPTGTQRIAVPPPPKSPWNLGPLPDHIKASPHRNL